MPVPLVCRNYFCFYIETEAGTKQAFDKRVLLNSLSPRCFHHQPASPPSSLRLPCPGDPFSAGSKALNASSLLDPSWRLEIAFSLSSTQQENWNSSLYSFSSFSFAPTSFFPSQPYLEDLPVLSAPHDPPLLTSPQSGPFTEMDLAEVTNDFHVASSNRQFYSYSIGFDIFNSFVFVP